MQDRVKTPVELAIERASKLEAMERVRQQIGIEVNHLNIRN